MDEIKTISILDNLRKRLLVIQLLNNLLLSVGSGLLLTSVGNRFFSVSFYWMLPVALCFFMVMLLWRRAWKVSGLNIARWLNEAWPQLGESANLLLQAPASMNILEQRQLQKTVAALQSIADPLLLKKSSLKIFLVTIGFITLAFTVRLFPNQQQIVSKEQERADLQLRHETVLPQVSKLRLRIQPPLYTHKAVREQDAFNVMVEQAASLEWMITSTKTAKNISLVFNDSIEVKMKRNAKDSLRWMAGRTIDSTGFYQLKIDGSSSALYKIEVIPDRPPVLTVLSPKPYTTIDIGEPATVRVKVEARDDYGLTDLHLMATIASGSGEAVKFREQKINLPGFVAGSTQSAIQQQLQLAAMGMQPGDELYFYVQAADNNHQQTRSDICIVRMPDTASLMSLEGLANSVILKPDYFRSERQIIIETTELLRQKDTLSSETFRNRSNNLGIDQKLLRLRYGKFLGDENESGESAVNDVAGIEDFSNADKVRDAFTDKHDNAEDASYYTADTKKQLRATLAEMWNAEMKLRTFDPQLALPFEYKALRLLKDLQQQSRVYVAKTNLRTTPPDPQKRLTGDLSRIEPLQLKQDAKPEPDPQQAVREALSVLPHAEQSVMNILQEANLQLHAKAVHEPAAYLEAVGAMTRIIANVNAHAKSTASDLRSAQHGLQLLLALPGQQPSHPGPTGARALSDAYFNHLQNFQH